MKKLIWPCKKLRCSSFLHTLPFFFLSSCSLRDDPLPRKAIPTLGVESSFNFLSPLQGLKSIAASEDNCSSLQSSIQTPVGKIAIAVHPIKEKRKTILQVEEDTFEILDPNTPAKVCKNNPATYKYVASLLEKAVPACRIQVQNNGFSCALPYHSAEDNLDKVKEVKLALLKQVKRVPYLLSRRLTLAENLASLLNSQHWADSLQAFCGVMEASLPVERPLILSSKLWRTALCTQDTSRHKYEVALIVLTKAVEEISFMHILQDEANLAGNLAVHVPNARLPASKKVWVKLEAAPDTVSNVLAAAENARAAAFALPLALSVKKHKTRKALRGKPASAELAKVNPVQDSTKTPRACWFPGFSTKEHYYEPGRYIGMWGNDANSPCPQQESKADFAGVARYFIDTISAETTFELMESNDKPLSLPAGPYLYSVYEIPDKLGEKLENHLVDQGTVIWNGSQQGLTIAEKIEKIK